MQKAKQAVHNGEQIGSKRLYHPSAHGAIVRDGGLGVGGLLLSEFSSQYAVLYYPPRCLENSIDQETGQRNAQHFNPVPVNRDLLVN